MAETSGLSSCTRCGAGARAVLHTTCDVCPDNHFVTADALACEPCPKQGVTCRQGLLTINQGWWAPSLSRGGGSVVNITSDTEMYGTAGLATQHAVGFA